MGDDTNEKKRILHFKGSWQNQWTKHSAFIDFLEAEQASRKVIFEKLFKSKPSYLDYESLYPELNLQNKVFGVYDPQCMWPNKLLDLFPFFEVILCLVHTERLRSPKDFERIYSCPFDDFLKLVDLGKIIPLLSEYPYASNDQYNFLTPLFKKQFPSYKRYWYILRNDYVNTHESLSDILALYNHAFPLLMKVCKPVFEKHGIREPLVSKLFMLMGQSLTRYDFAQAFLLLDWVAHIVSKDSSWLEDEKILHALGDINQWYEQPYIAPGAVTIYADYVIEFMRETTLQKHDLLLRLLKGFPGATEELLTKAVRFIDITPMLSADRLAVLRNTYFFEPPEIYGDPVRYHHYLSHSDNVKEHFGIAKAFNDDISTGKFRQASNRLSSCDYSKIIKEINTEVQTIENLSKFMKVGVQFGATVIGAATGALFGQAFQQGEITLLFSYLGANAASTLTKDHADSVSRRLLTPSFPKFEHCSYDMATLQEVEGLGIER